MLLKWMLLSASVLGAADLSGTWLGKMPTRNGEFQDFAFKFVQKSSVLSGKMYGDYESTPISEGIVAGDSVTFIIQLQEQAGNQINDTRVRFTGKITGDRMELVREREASTNAGNGGAVQLKNNTRQTCRLERLTP